MATSKTWPVGDVWDRVREALRDKGIDLESLAQCCESDERCADAGKPAVRVVCLTPDMRCCVEEMSKRPRDHVVMVRCDEETASSLDAWVESGVVRSRSEAAALFIREGLKVRAQELDLLRDAVRDVEQAKSRLREKAAEVLGGGERRSPANGAPEASE